MPETKPTLDERIQKLEELSLGDRFKNMQGTTLQRVNNPNGPGTQWCLALGPLSMPKEFFYGLTVEEVVSTAEDSLAKRISEKSPPLVTEMDKLGAAFAAFQGG